MGRAYDPARETRARLLRLEQRAKARTEVAAIADGVAETVALSRARGAAIHREPAARGERDAAYRRQPGLEWLARKGRLTPPQAQAGERYGACYRRARVEAAIASTLETQPGGGLPAGPPLSALLEQVEGRRRAQEQLARYRARLMQQEDLIAACDRICGEELTPREAGGGEREAGRLEAVLKVALDILARG
jgi:hypothetical protein